MVRQRVWLSRDEWDCCGVPFEVGHRVTFRTDPRSEELATLLGRGLAPSVDRQESHHQEGGRDEVTGTVVAISAVALEYVERHVSRTTAPLAPSVPSGKIRSSAGFIVTHRSEKPYTVVREWVPGSARLSTIPRVPWPRESEPVSDGQPALAGLAGYLVEIELR